MTFDDLEATPSVENRKKANPVDVKAGKDWNSLQADKTFTSRFEELAVTDKELDLLRLNAPDLYQVYVKRIREKGGTKLKEKMTADDAAKYNRNQIEKNMDKR
jgi:hypothetical protein